MKLQKMLFVLSMLMFLVSSTALAGDFDWIRDFNIRAEADPSGSGRDLQLVLTLATCRSMPYSSNVAGPADAYMVLRLGEMSSQPADYVIGKYKTGKGNGWGALAKSLGIKPGSKEFHDLKRGSDLYENRDSGKGKGKSKGKGKGKS